jgi:hypothetical protein
MYTTRAEIPWSSRVSEGNVFAIHCHFFNMHLFVYWCVHYEHVKGKAIPVTGRGGLKGCEMSRIQQYIYICIYNRLKDGGEVVSLTRQPRFVPQEDSPHSFLSEAESNPRPQWLEGLEKSEQFNGLIRTKTRDLQACSAVPQSITLIRYILLSGEINEVG